MNTLIVEDHVIFQGILQRVCSTLFGPADVACVADGACTGSPRYNISGATWALGAQGNGPNASSSEQKNDTDRVILRAEAGLAREISLPTHNMLDNSHITLCRSQL